MGWKLCAPGSYRLACRAEELAMRAIIQHAEVLLRDRGLEPDFDLFRTVVFQDETLEMLFDRSRDGTENFKEAAGVHLRFEDWFKPFSSEDPVHPYLGSDADLDVRGGGGSSITG